MADTGSTQFPNSPRIDSKTGNTGVKTIFTASLIGVPNANKGAENKIQHLKGTVINQNDKGQVRIQTDKGVVEVQLPKDSKGHDVPLRQGQKVEVEIPPEKVRQRSADTVRIKTDSPPPQDKPQERPTNASSEQAQNTAPARERPQTSNHSRNESTSTKQTDNKPNIQVQKPTLAQIPAPETTAEGVKQQNTIALAKLVGETIRLDPLPAGSSSQIILPDVQILPQTITPAALTPLKQIIQIDINTAQSQNTLTLSKPHAAQLPTTAITAIEPQGQLEKIISNQLITEKSAPVSFTFAEAKTQTPAPIIPEQNTLIPLNKELMQGIAFKKIIPAITATIKQIGDQQAAPSSEALKPTPITAQIATIKPPALSFTVPSAPNEATPPPEGKPFQLGAFSITEPQNIILETKAPGVITAQIIGKTEYSLPVVSIAPSPDSLPQNFILQVPSHDIAAGSQIELTPQSQSTLNTLVLTTSTAQMPLPAPGYFLTPGQWPLMEDILHSVQQTSAQAGQAITSSIPNAAQPAQMTPAALFFMAALRAGDLSSILGERAQQILRGQGKGGLLSRLSQEGNIMNRTEQAPSSEWRSLTLPMAWDNEIQKVALHYKHDYPDSDDKDKGEKQTRFIFDLSLSRMGNVQLDGLHRGDHLNIIIRTETGISQAMQATMKQAYHSSLETTELAGDLSFQSNLDSWVKINAADDDHFTEQI